GPTVGQVLGSKGTQSGLGNGFVPRPTRPVAGTPADTSTSGLAVPRGSGPVAAGTAAGGLANAVLRTFRSGGGSAPAQPGPLLPFGSLTGSTGTGFNGPTIFVIFTLLGLVAAGLSRWLRLLPDHWPPSAFLSLLGEPG